ncbi:MAG: exodeoxyribonuclease VII large subunit [Cyanobacteriota bacterium]|nr:exodeoxyribonuclease VII large subunit [Cyanobacteriota bacterium]
MPEPIYSIGLSPATVNARQLADLTAGIPVLSVAGVAQYIQALLQEDPHLLKLWVTGEVSSCSQQRHLFLTLTDAETGDALKAVAWQNQMARLTFLPKVGQQVMALGQIRTYAKGSTYQLQIWDLLPAGEGLLALRYQQMKARLEAEGLFDPHLKRPLPRHPSCIAVVTSPQSAAWGDIQKTLRRRYPGLWVLLVAAVVQGEQAAASLIQAIQTVEQDGRAEVVIVARGGGAAEDLWCFNDERLVRSINQCRIPVLTGIGHERDETLADLAADCAAHTPTAAAERVVPSLEQLHQQCTRLHQHLHQQTQYQLQLAHLHIQTLRQRLERWPLDQHLQQHQQQQTERIHRLRQLVHQRLQQAHSQQQALRQQLLALDPQAVLQRGYALVRGETGVWIRSNQLPAGTPLVIELASGHLRVRVEAHAEKEFIPNPDSLAL